jgi:hypothetical protein
MNERPWNSLDSSQRQTLLVDGLALFPSMLWDGQKKYVNYAAWLLSRHSVRNNSLRDIFTAGGKKDIKLNGNFIYQIPQIYYKIYKHKKILCNRIISSKKEELIETWCVEKIENNRIAQWITIANSNIKDQSLHELLTIIINSSFND